MLIRILAVLALGVISGCSSQQLARDLLPECKSSGNKPVSRAAGCMTAAAYEIALEKSEAPPKATAESKSSDIKPRF